jgi:membrane protease subunit HflK
MRYLLALTALVLVGLTLQSAVTQVQPGERAVVRRFGRVLADKPGPGLYVGLPWGIDRVDRVQVDRVRRVTVGYDPAASEEGSQTPPGQMVTGDHNLIDVQVEIYYAVKPDEVERFVFQADRADGLVARAAETALVEWVAGQTVDSLVSGDRQGMQDRVRALTQERLAPYELGVAIQGATITYLNPPRQVKADFAAVAQEETRRETAINQARQAANTRLLDAKAEAFHIRRLTAAYQKEQRLQAQAEAATFNRQLEQYRRLRRENPGYLNGLWWDEISRLYARLRETGRIDLLDNYLGADGLDITQMPALLKKR